MMPKTLRRASDEYDTTLTDEQRRAIEAHVHEHTARLAAASEPTRQMPQQDNSGHSSETSDQQGEQGERRLTHPQISATLARDIARRNRHQLAPHVLTAGLVAAAAAVHSTVPTHALSTAALTAGAVCTSVGAVGIGLARKRGLLDRQWTAWAGLVTLTAAVWLTLTVATGVGWLGLAAALAADYALGARWWQHHRHPHAVEPDAGPVEVVEVDESLIATFIQRWTDNVARPGGVLPGSTLVYADTFDRGIEYTLYLDPGQQSMDQVRNNLGRIESGLRHKQENLVVDPHDDGDDPSVVTLRIITTSPVKEDVLFSQLRYHDGQIPLGPYADGIGEATWRLYSDDSMWGGIVIGATGTGKSRLLEMLALEALYTRCTYVIHLDGQDGSSCPTLWGHAQERYGVDDVDSLLDRLHQMMRHRNRVCGGSFTPTPDLPGVLVIVDETNAVLNRDNVDQWAHIARQGRKCGIAVVMGDQDGGLDTFIKSVLRGQLRKGNGVGMKTEESSQGQILGKGKLDLSELPDIPGFGYTLGNSQRRAPYKGRFLMAQKDANRARQRGQTVPSDVVLIEQWYADAPKTPLDAGTDTADGGHQETGGGQPDRRTTVRGSDGPALVPMALPTVGTPQAPEPAPRTAPGLTDAQYQVLDTVNLGLLTPAEIADKLGLSRKHVTNVLAQLIERGLVTKSGAGRAVRYEAATTDAVAG